MGGTRPRILCVDDEPAVLEGISRNLRRDFEVVTAESGPAALARIQDATVPFVVMTSDFRMPGMDGVTLLGKVRSVSPDTTRILLTGHADMNTALLAVNEGHVFRFLTKPCPPDALMSAIRAGAGQHDLVTAQRVLLEQTLRGTIQTLTRVLGLASPEAFGRAARLKGLVEKIGEKLGISERWPLEVAAMISQMGAIVLPPDTLGKHHRGEPLSEDEQRMIDRLPGVVEGLLDGIPRLDAVREILRYSTKGFDGSGVPADKLKGDAIPLGARILRVALDYDTEESRGSTVHLALHTLGTRADKYDPVVLGAATELLTTVGAGSPLQEQALREVKAGALLAADVKTKTGVLLVARGQTVTLEMLERLRNVSGRMGVAEPILCQY